ncbi:MAG: hypothetical protein ACP5OR_03980 [Candidatus Dormibacteria bacterium]
MGLFSRKSTSTQGDPSPAFPQGSSPSSPLVGELPCSAPGCSNTTGVACAYIDRRNRKCKTSWCPEHQFIVNGKCYCRRHANTVDAVGDQEHTTYGFAMPDLSNRAPSLVRWIANDISDRVEELLSRYRISGEQYRRERVHAVRSVDGSIRWEVTWQLFDHTGSRVRVSIEVKEAVPTTLNARVGQLIVYSEVPPWILHRERNEEVSPETDTRERDMFYEMMLKAIDEHLTDNNEEY